MAERELFAHSLAEAYLYPMITPCPSCGKGPLISGDATITPPHGRFGLATIPARCRACGFVISFQFRVAAQTGPEDELNPTDEPSRLIDLAQWVTLARIITEAASRSDDRVQARGFRIQAHQCLDEALKFFEDGSSTPPSTAFFTPESQDLFRAQPQRFERARLLHLRDRLPNHSSARPDQ